MSLKLIGGDLLVLGGAVVPCECCTHYTDPDNWPTPGPGFSQLMWSESVGNMNGCVAVPPAETLVFPLPITPLLTNRYYRLWFEFSTGDEIDHIGVFQEIQITFSWAVNTLNWLKFANGVTANPWSTANNGKTLRFTAETSASCGGTNANIQKGLAISNIFYWPAGESMSFINNGLVEDLNGGFDMMIFSMERMT